MHCILNWVYIQLGYCYGKERGSSQKEFSLSFISTILCWVEGIVSVYCIAAIHFMSHYTASIICSHDSRHIKEIISLS